MKFTAVLELNGKTATGFVVPPEVVEELGSGKRPAVIVRIGGHSYRNTVAVMGGRYMIGVSAENRAAAGVAAGDEVEIELELDTAPREVVVPPDLAAALEAEPAAKAKFESLSYSGKRQHTLSVEGAKTEATRQRRIEKAIATLRG
ncbi:MAG TPA: YdeI/OmpD-associated family protein [Mycobacteriales bacterium]|nr:YdeI/OmpD-associated family protein [Mycobacteriales bacterium]